MKEDTDIQQRSSLLTTTDYHQQQQQPLTSGGDLSPLANLRVLLYASEMAQPPQDHKYYPPPPASASSQGLMQAHPGVYPPHPAQYGRQVMQPGVTMVPAPPPMPQSHVDVKGRKYTLTVVQEPVRARMCGFGDKDRRPITPPPCILLLMTDANTGAPIDITDLDVSYFVLTVDLWSIDGTHEVNLVRHSATSPSISATTSSSYPPPPTPPPGYPYGAPLTHVSMAGNYGQAYQYQQAPHSQGYAPTHQAYPASGAPLAPGTFYPAPLMTGNGVMQTQDPRSAPMGMFTRNLIGSLAVTASKLNDTHGKLGIWFILQDLSVRTEGQFRLKMSLTDISMSAIGGDETEINRSEAPILATTFSQEFQVFSAKKFPGVIESTPLSKCFATQGVKIPIRKDGPSKREDDDD